MIYSLQLPPTIKKGWGNSPLKNLPNCTPQFKGNLGTVLIRQYFEQKGVSTEKISDEGDLIVGGRKSEVKTALVSYKFNQSGYVNETLWWNQIRPLQSGWELLHLVAVYPDKVCIWEFDRDNGLMLAESTGGCEHTGQGEEKGLLAVQIDKKKTKTNFDLLGKYGKLIAEIDVNDIQIS